MTALHARRTHPTPVEGCWGCHAATLHLSPPSFHEHFNWSVGQYIRSEAEHREALKVCAERNSLATGMNHQYELRHPEDLKPISNADQVLDDRARALS